MTKPTGFYKKDGKTRPITEKKNKSTYRGQRRPPYWKHTSIQDVKEEVKETRKARAERRLKVFRAKVKQVAKEKVAATKRGIRERLAEAREKRREEARFKKELKAIETEAYRETMKVERAKVAKAKAKAKAHRKSTLSQIGTFVSKQLKKTKKRAPRRKSKKRSPQVKWIAGAIEKPGTLRATVQRRFGKKGFTQRGTIKVSILNKLSKEKGVTGKRARLAKTLRKL